MAVLGGGQSVGGGAYKGIPYDSGTDKIIVRRSGGGSSGGGGQSTVSQAELQRRTQELQQQEQARKAAAKKKAEEEAKKIEEERLRAEAEKRRIEQLRRIVAVKSMDFAKKQRLNAEIGRRIYNLVKSGYDIYSGGSLTENRILKRQDELNKDVNRFNEKYTSSDLDEKKYKEALLEQRRLEEQQKNINQEFNKLAQSTRSRIYGFLNPLEKRRTIEEASISQNKLISKTEKDLKDLKNELATTTSKYKKFILPRIISSTEKELLRYKAGDKPIVLMGDLPLVPLKTIPSGITKISFLGTQKKLSDGRTLVNIAYKTNTGRVGKAQAYVKLSAKKVANKPVTISKIAGRSGAKYYTPTGSRIKKIETFLGVEKSISKPKIAKLTAEVIGGGKAKTVKNARIINQLSAGKVGVIRGSPFIRSEIARIRAYGGLPFKKPKIDYQTFVALSKSLSKKDLTFIAGKSITGQRAQSKFIGLIKNIGNVNKISKAESRQISIAVKKLVNSMLGSIGAVEVSQSRLTGINKLAAVISNLKTITRNPKVFNAKVLESPQLIKNKLVRKTKMSTSIMQPSKITKSVLRSSTAQRNRIKQLQQKLNKTKSKTDSINIQNNINKLRQKLRSKQRSRMKQKALTIRPTFPPIISPNIKRIVRPFAFKLNANFKPKTLPKSQSTFYVVEKVRGKFKKLFPKPLTKKDARDYAAYSIDNRLSKTAFFVPLGRAKNIVRPPKNIQGYFSGNSRKFRPYRIRFGKKKQLVNGFIEKRRFFQDTRGEKKALRVARRISPARRRELIRQLEKARAARFGTKVRKTTTRAKRKTSPSQRKELLKRLAKARRVRMSRLRRRR